MDRPTPPHALKSQYPRAAKPLRQRRELRSVLLLPLLLPSFRPSSYILKFNQFTRYYDIFHHRHIQHSCSTDHSHHFLALHTACGKPDLRINSEVVRSKHTRNTNPVVNICSFWNCRRGPQLPNGFCGVIDNTSHQRQQCLVVRRRRGYIRPLYLLYSLEARGRQEVEAAIGISIYLAQPYICYG